MPTPFVGGVPATRGPGSPVRSFSEKFAGTLPLLSGTTDDFDAATIDPKWTFSTTSGGSAAQTGGELVFNGNTSTAFTGDGNADLTSPGTLDSVFVKLSGPVARAANATGLEAAFVLRNAATPDDRYLGFFQTSDGFLYLSAASGAGVFSNTQLTFSAATHAWLRFSYSGGVASFDTAPSTASNPPIASDWTSRSTIPLVDIPWITEAAKTRMHLRVTAALTSASEATCKFDGYNTLATVAAAVSVSSATTDGADVLASNVAPVVAASSARTDGADALAASAAPVVAVSSATTDGADAASAAVAPIVAVSGASTDGADVASANVAPIVAVTAATTDGADVLAAGIDPQATSVSASSATTDGADVLSAQSSVVVGASAALVEGADTLAAAADPAVALSSAQTDGADTLSAAVEPLGAIDLSAAPVNGADSLDAVVDSGARASGGFGFEMTSGKRVREVSFKPLLQRLIEERAKPLPAPKRHAAQVKAVEVKAAEAVLSGAGENKLQALMQQWIAAKPALPERKTDVLPLFLAQVAYRLRQMEQDEEDALLLLL